MEPRKTRIPTLFAAALAAIIGTAPVTAGATQAHEGAGPHDGEWTLSLLQMGDIHGHLIPRPHLRSDGTGAELGGLAYMYTKIAEIRGHNPHTLLFNTGDTIQGSAEALYTRGQALVDVLDKFGIDAFAPGNWDYVYGTERFIELFGKGRWGGVAANVYYDGAVYPDKAGQHVLPPYIIKRVRGLKIGIMGLSTERITLALGPWATRGFIATHDGRELPALIDKLRNEEKVDVLVLASEFGLAKNIWFAETYPGIDVVLSSDMHEETREAVITSNGTLVTEVGQDGTRLGEVSLRMRGRNIVGKDYTFHTIEPAKLRAHPGIAAQIRNVRRHFVAGRHFEPHTNPFNGMVLTRPIDSVVGMAEIGLHRSNYSYEHMPASVEGTSHDFLADAFRQQADTDVGHIRGFRYGTHVAPGPIKLEDLYHYMPIGAQIAKTTISGQMLKNYLENNVAGSFNSDIFAWTGGWLMGLSGVRYDLDLYAAKGNRIRNVMVQDRVSGEWLPLEAEAAYGFAGYWYPENAGNVGGLASTTAVEPLHGEYGEVLDGTEVVVNYLKTHTANPETDRVRLILPLPAPAYGNPEMQPLKGATL